MFGRRPRDGSPHVYSGSYLEHVERSGYEGRELTVSRTLIHNHRTRSRDCQLPRTFFDPRPATARRLGQLRAVNTT